MDSFILYCAHTIGIMKGWCLFFFIINFLIGFSILIDFDKVLERQCERRKGVSRDTIYKSINDSTCIYYCVIFLFLYILLPWEKEFLSFFQ